MADIVIEGTVRRLPNPPVHLYQLNRSPDAYYNEKGCGAFTTAMALSHYNPARFGTPNAAREIFDQMLKVPFVGGTFEFQNARLAKRYGLLSKNYDHGTPADLAAAIDCGAPTIMLVNPGRFGIGQHDVLLVGYSVNSSGNWLRFFVDNPAVESAPSEAALPQEFPGNASYSVPDLSEKWTRCFTPIFESADVYARWCALTGRD
jgi:hypothetical protein